VLAVERVPADVSATASSTSQKQSAGRLPAARPGREAAPGEAPSNLAIIGRYVLTPDVFGALKDTRVDLTGEIQLTNGLRRLLEDRPLYACEVKGVRHDTGNKHGYLRAVVYFALRRPDLAGPFLDYLRSIDLQR
jgi:UTP--glucose-1-phosphate uridylyltransferase